MIGFDSSILVFVMDPITPEHLKAAGSLESLEEWAINPTVVHEVYHTLVFKRRLAPADAEPRLRRFIQDRRTKFYSLTKKASVFSLGLASKFELGGRDSVILGCYLMNGVDSVFTHDQSLLQFEKMRFRGRQIAFSDPVA